MLAYAAEVAERKRAEPGDDIASTLVQAEVDGDRLTDGELQWFFLLLVNAGGDTTRNLVAAGMQLLFDHPDERARLLADLDGLLPTAIEEMLRYTSPGGHFRRTAMEDTEIGEQPIAAGDKVMMFYGSANRDEDVFADPDRFDVGRTPNPHLAFGGGGPHLCLGLHVARIEIAVDAARAAHPPAPTSRRPAARAPGVELHRRGAHDAGAFTPGARRPRGAPPRGLSPSPPLPRGGGRVDGTAAITGANASIWSGVPSRWRATIASCTPASAQPAVAADVLLDGADHAA